MSGKPPNKNVDRLRLPQGRVDSKTRPPSDYRMRASSDYRTRTPSDFRTRAPSDPWSKAPADPRMRAPVDPRVRAPADPRTRATADPRTRATADFMRRMPPHLNAIQGSPASVGSDNLIEVVAQFPCPPQMCKKPVSPGVRSNGSTASFSMPTSRAYPEAWRQSQTYPQRTAPPSKTRCPKQNGLLLHRIPVRSEIPFPSPRAY